MFANPIGVPTPATRIQGNTEEWKGSPIFRVTSTFAQHVASGRGTGIDFGNLRCGDPVYSVAPGTVSQVFTDSGNGSIIVRINHGNIGPGGAQVISGYAHLASKETVVGTKVARGVAIGHVGKTGATACHLHWGVTIGGKAVDGWPLLDQNIAAPVGDDVNVTFEPLPNRTTTVNAGARHRLAPNLDPAGIAIASDPGGPLKFPLSGSVKGVTANGSDLWYVYWRPEVDKWYYLHSTVCGPLTPFEATSGASPEELTAAKNAGFNEGRSAVQGAAMAVPAK